MKNTTANVIRVYDLYHQMIRISDTWSEAWSLDDLKRVAKLQMDSTSDAAYVRISMIDGTEFVEHNKAVKMIRIPYSPRYHENMEHLAANDTPCAICGKATGVPNPYIHTYEGAWVVLSDQVDTLDPAGDTGCWPIGPDCLKKHPELKVYTA